MRTATWIGLVVLLFAGCKSGPKAIPGMCFVKKGPYTLGSDANAAEDGATRQYRLEKDIYIDKFEVTNEDFQAFMKETNHPAPPHWTNGQIPEGKEKHPVVHVAYADAEAFAKWKGKRLPTEEEWESAARGFEARLYPWGSEYDKEKCNGADSGIGDTTEVGKFEADASPCGAHDMAGNVWEWTDSWLDGTNKKRVIRGSSFSPFDPDPRATKRAGREPEKHNELTGFRCAKDAAVQN